MTTEAWASVAEVAKHLGVATVRAGGADGHDSGDDEGGR